VGAADRGAWEQVRGLSLEAIGESTFEIWLQPLELIAVHRDGTLIVSAPEATVSWVRDRFGRLLDRAAERAGRRLRLADTVEGKAAATLIPMSAAPASGAPVVSPAGTGRKRRPVEPSY
jgi:hypothetical protein